MGLELPLLDADYASLRRTTSITLLKKHSNAIDSVPKVVKKIGLLKMSGI